MQRHFKQKIFEVTSGYEAVVVPFLHNSGSGASARLPTAPQAPRAQISKSWLRVGAGTPERPRSFSSQGSSRKSNTSTLNGIECMQGEQQMVVAWCLKQSALGHQWRCNLNRNETRLYKKDPLLTKVRIPACRCFPSDHPCLSTF